MPNILDNCRYFALNMARAAVTQLLPQECLLCAGLSLQAPVCDECCGSLPTLPANRCPRCAMPVATAETCGRCTSHPPHFDATHAVFRYAKPGDRLITSLKYSHRLPAAAFLAKQLVQSLRRPRALPVHHDGLHAGIRSAPLGIDAPVDVVIGLPLHPHRLARRGFNQSVEIGRRAANALNIAFSTDLIVRHRDTQPQADLPLKHRRANVRGAFSCPAKLAGRRIAVVDDVMTSGATLDEVARTLKRAGAVHVENWVLARTWPTDRHHAARAGMNVPQRQAPAGAHGTIPCANTAPDR